MCSSDLKRLSSIRSFHVKVSWEDNEVEDDFIFGMITNSTSVGGFKNITGKNVKMDSSSGPATENGSSLLHEASMTLTGSNVKIVLYMKFIVVSFYVIIQRPTTWGCTSCCFRPYGPKPHHSRSYYTMIQEPDSKGERGFPDRR